MNRILAGALGGLAGTSFMTAAMNVLHRRLPARERYALPPAEVVARVASQAGVYQRLSAPARAGLALAAHVAFGMLCGTLYAQMLRRTPRPAAAGVLFALGVWATSYQIAFPALGLLRPATQRPARRTALMVAAHVVYGVVLGQVTQELISSRRSTCD